MPLGQFAVQAEKPHLFDARRVSPRFRQEALFAAFAALRIGEAIRSCHDEEPTQMMAGLTELYGVTVATTDVSREPGLIVIDIKRLPLA